MINSTTSDHRVLLVEDEKMVAGILQRMLTELGYTVVGPASDVDEAMTMIDGGGIDAAVLNISLEGGTSYPVADVLATLGIPFVFSTGYGKEILFSSNHHAAPLLKKPYRRSELGDALADLLPARQSSGAVAIKISSSKAKPA